MQNKNANNKADEWQMPKNNKKTRNVANNDVDNATLPKNTVNSNKIGDDIKLNNNYVLWAHGLHNNDWSLASYSRLCEINNVSSFWKLFNNFDKLGYKQNCFFFMKDDTQPIWEHENNRNGGVCSFKITIDSSLRTYEDLCTHMVLNLLMANSEMMSDVNGISFSPKNNWAIIKIWNKDKKNDLSLLLNPLIIKKYQGLSIKYISNEPEY